MKHKLYTYLVEYYDALFSTERIEKEVDFLMARAREVGLEELRVLDIGCGTGSHLQLIEEHADSLTGIDISSEMLDKARRKLRSTQLMQLDMMALSEAFSASEFNLCYCISNTIAYLTSPDQLNKLFQSVANVLKIPGIFVFDLWKYIPCHSGCYVGSYSSVVGGESLTRAMAWEPHDNILVSQDCIIVHRENDPIVVFDRHEFGLFELEKVVGMLSDRGFTISAYDGFNDLEFQRKQQKPVFVASRS